MKKHHGIFLLLLCASCQQQDKPQQLAATVQPANAPVMKLSFDSTISTIHVMVALCDNKYQGIVPVPAALGNGQQPNTNLYWGAANGVKSYFKKSSSWTFIKRYTIDSIKMERLIFKHKKQRCYLVADAFNGKYIRQCTIDFLQSCAGQVKDTLQVNNTAIGINGNARLIAYIGHDGLMDFRLAARYNNTDGKVREAIILACISRKYFTPHLLATKAHPLLWTTGLMCPEAYTLHAAIDSYIRGLPAQTCSAAGAKAYASYQHCSSTAARNLLVTGW